MSSTPLSASTAGFSSRGSLLLVLAGTALAGFVFVVLPRLSESRAESSRRSTPVRSETPLAEQPPAVLVEPDLAVDTPPPPVEVVATSTVVARSAVEEAQVEDEGPKLKYIKGSGQAKVVDHTDPRVSNREQRKHRRENAARGIPPETQTKVFKTPPDPSRLSTRGGSGIPLQSKGKKQKGGG